jgi:DNA-3-methyladenine glycosylase
MFGPPGHLYVYLSYGVHQCANLVAEADGEAGAVLLRAAAVERGEAEIRRRRLLGRAAVRPLRAEKLLSGPGNFCRGLGIAPQDNGADVCTLTARFSVWSDGTRPPLVAARRVGISRNVEPPLRFAWRDHPAVSAPRPL